MSLGVIRDCSLFRPQPMNQDDWDRVEVMIIKAVGTAVPEAVTKSVNGKIDGMRSDLKDHTDKHDEQWKQVAPFVQGVSGAKILAKGLTWLSGIAAAWIVIRSFWTQP